MPEVSLWQLTLEPSGQFFDPARLATNLFMVSIRIFNEVTNIEGEKELDPAMFQEMNHQKHRFKLWGANFDAREGGLDEHYEGADHLKETLFRVLRRMAEALTTMAHHTSLAEELTDVFQEIEELKSQVSQVIDKRATDEDDERRTSSRSSVSFPRITLDDFSSSESEGSSQDEDSHLEEAAKDVEFSNDLLFQLGPALHDNAERAALRRERSEVYDEGSQQMMHTGAGPYIASVLESFPSINPELARRLGEANQARYYRLQKARDEAALRPDESEIGTYFWIGSCCFHTVFRGTLPCSFVHRL